MPVSSEAETVEFISKVRAKNHDARHVAFAYVLANGEKRCSDDGEPQGTAGLPLLNVLEQNELSYCAVTVTRYFGGILLGPGGLTRAYSKAAALALENATVKVITYCKKAKITCDYSFYGRLPSLVAEYDGIIDSSDFTDEVTLNFFIPEKKTEGFSAALTELSCGKVEVLLSDGGYMELKP